MPLFTIPTTFENAHARYYTHEALLTQSVTQVGSSLLDSSMLWLFRKAITSPIIVSTSSLTCFTDTNSIAIDLITVKNQFFSQHRPPATIRHFFLLWWGDCATTLALHMLQKICPMKISITIYFYIWTWYEHIIAIIRACRCISIKYKSTGSSATCSWYIVP